MGPAVRAALLSGLLAAAYAAGAPPAAGQQDGGEGARPPEACPAADDGPSLVGSVRDANTGLSLSGARVLVRRHPGADSPAAELRADSTGSYRLCGGPPGTTLAVRPVLPSGSGDAVEVTLPGAGERPLRRDLALELGRPGEVLGEVRDAEAGSPVEAATVRLPALGVRAVTSGDGRFELPPLPPGRYEARVEHVGHGVHADSIDVRSDRTVRLRMRITPDPVRLAPLAVEVEGVRSMWLSSVGFYDRRQRGHGTYITREQLEEWDTSHLSDVFRRVQGFSVGGPQVRRSLHSNRDARASTRSGPCRTQYFVNGEAQPLPNGIDTFTPADIAALEVYRGSAQLPAEFNRRSASCGAVVVWLRSRLER